MHESMKTIVVSGALANKSGHGGEALVRQNRVLGFRELGWFTRTCRRRRGSSRLHRSKRPLAL